MTPHLRSIVFNVQRHMAYFAIGPLVLNSVNSTHRIGYAVCVSVYVCVCVCLSVCLSYRNGGRENGGRGGGGREGNLVNVGVWEYCNSQMLHIRGLTPSSS